jgi:transcriptional regulator NrdR family protein
MQDYVSPTEARQAVLLRRIRKFVILRFTTVTDTNHSHRSYIKRDECREQCVTTRIFSQCLFACQRLTV